MGAICSLLKRLAGLSSGSAKQGMASDVEMGSTHPMAKLDMTCRGPTVLVGGRGAGGGEQVRGSGTVLCNTSIQQDRAYFEVTVETPGEFRVGCGQRPKLAAEDYEGGALDKHLGEGSDATWGLPVADLNAGDCIAVTYDQLSSATPELNFYINGTMLEGAIIAKKTRGPVFPAISLAPPTVLRVNFGNGDNFEHELPNGFMHVVPSSDLI